jgi:membrane protease subunit (stomatin/prohibitin family)
MAMIAFTANHTDHSTQNGFQFEFHCDRCGNGHMSSFQTSKLGVAGEMFRAAGSLFGGVFGRAAQATDRAKDAFRGKARDEAFARAVEEARPHFRQCSRCGKWVCPEHCWNAEKGLCEGCAPDLAEEAAAAQAQAAKEQVWEKARQVDHVAQVDMKAAQAALCPHCGAKSTGGKFCGQCGKPLSAKAKCPKCSAEVQAGAKFCPQCGEKMG